MKINSKIIKEAVKNLCVRANTFISKDVYDELAKMYLKEENENAKFALSQIFENISLAKAINRPLCQDTGIVVVFLEIGQEVQIEGEFVEDVINGAIKEAYFENAYRKSTVSEPIFKRKNEGENLPAVIHTKIVKGDEIKIKMGIKGAGSENMSALKMLKPSDGVDGIVDFVVQAVKNASSNPCPPIRIGIGVGGDFEKCAIMAKEALLDEVKSVKMLEKSEDELSKLELEILNKINELDIGPMGLGGKNTCFSVNIRQYPSHMASLPVAVNINCHSSREAVCVIKNNEISYVDNFDYDFLNLEKLDFDLKELNLQNVEEIKKSNLKQGEMVLLTGTIYGARDKAHQKIFELIKENKPLPFEIKDSSIFYVGPCPKKEGEIIGPIGPTTSSRMDKFAPMLYEMGMFSTIGKGERSREVQDAIKKTGGIYFTVVGGVASLLAKNVKEAKVIAFEELGAEAVYEFKVEKLPAFVAVK